MRITNFTKTDTYYKFVCEDGSEMLYPISAVIIVDDNSGAKTVKVTASRKTIGLIIQ